MSNEEVILHNPSDYAGTPPAPGASALEWAQHHRRAAENAAYQASADYWHASGERDQLEVEKNAWLKEKADLEEELEDLQRKVAKLKSRNKALKKKVAKLEKEKNE